ncbi:chromosome segregation protein [Mucor ambiguus]|uniref:Chromosome segregation protein n=1 Tax=Mucor ambiguus TaxID=91626 RepID=A0A0C9N061_9FUNG|nr:chromosome segregation protein [Mucor ambiguus]
MSTLFEDVKVIYGFSDGRTVVAYKPDGKEAVVGGADGTGLHIYETESVNEEYQHVDISEHVEDVTCVATNKHGAFASGGTDGIVNLYTKDNTFNRILVRSTTPVRDISFHPDGTKLAVATDDPVVRIVLCADNSKIVNLEGHKHLVKSVNYDCFGNHIISSDVQGNIRIWNVSPQEPAPRCVKVLQEYCYQSDIDSILQAKVAWHPADASCFAFPGTNNDIRVFKAGIWTPDYSLDQQHTSNVITFAWSPNGYYIASSAEDSTLVIWDTKTKTHVRIEITSTAITGIAWHPTDNELFLTDMSGNLRIWKEPIPTDNSNYPHPAKTRKKPTSAGVPASQHVFKTNKDKPSSLPLHSSSLFADEEAQDDDDEEGDDVDMMEELGEGVDEEEELGENDMGDFVIDDDGAGYVETDEQASERKKQSKLNMASNGSAGMANAALVQRQRKLEAAFDPPTTFQPGETPYHKPEPNTTFEPQQGERRYMAYNLVGAISTIYEDGHSIINVEFHDQSEYRNFHFTDVLNFSMGAISSAGTVYAVEGKEAVKTKGGRRENGDLLDSDNSDDEEEEETTQINSTLYFRPNNSGSEKDWTHHMLPGEDVVSIAINRVSVIATTSLGYVRIFSISGVQRYIFSLENVVSVTAMTDLALLVYSAGPAFGHQQNLDFMLINTETNEVLQKDKIQLTTDSELNWIGFSETNQAATFDSAGILRLLYHQRRPFQSRWMPVFDSRAYAAANQRTETYWPVGVLRDRLMCVVLRGANTYPFFPRPPVKDISLQLPLLEQSTEVGQLEESVLRIQACNAHEKDEAEATNTEEDYADTFTEADSDMDVALLKLINIACKTEKVSKALDMTYILHSPESIDKAIKIAIHYRYTSLAEKMTSIKQAKFINETMPTPSTLADSLAALPSIYASTQPTLEGDLAFVNRDKGKEREASNKRNMHDSEDEDMTDTPSLKKSRPFSFSTQR